jgi:hypothetical protein
MGQGDSRFCIAGLGKLPATGVGFGRHGNQQENGFEDHNQITGPSRTSASNRGEFCNQSPSDTERKNALI